MREKYSFQAIPTFSMMLVKAAKTCCVAHAQIAANAKCLSAMLCFVSCPTSVPQYSSFLFSNHLVLHLGQGITTKVTKCRHGASVFYGPPTEIRVGWTRFSSGLPSPQAVCVQQATASAFNHSAAILDFLLLAAQQCKKYK